jgi:choline kinase
MTNAIYYVSTPDNRHPKTLLLRIYGESSASLISRSKELRILHVLSSQYQIAPRVYGTFGNGRVEEYLEAKPLTASDLRDPQISRWIAIRLAELHRVDIDRVFSSIPSNLSALPNGEIGVACNIREWIPVARQVLEMNQDPRYAEEMDLDRFEREWTTYCEWITDWENKAEENKSRRAFCHNDILSGNVLRLEAKPEGLPNYHQVRLLPNVRMYM